MEQCEAVVAGPRELDLASHGGRRKEEEGGKAARRRGSGVLIGQRAPGRGEWRLGEAGLVRGDSTASGRSEQAALRMAVRRGSSGGRLGRVCTRGGAKGRPGGAERFPRVHLAAGARWMKSTGSVRRAAGNRALGRERDEGEGLSIISENPGTSR